MHAIGVKRESGLDIQDPVHHVLQQLDPMVRLLMIASLMYSSRSPDPVLTTPLSKIKVQCLILKVETQSWS